MLPRRILSALILLGLILTLLWADYVLGNPQSYGRPGLVLSLVALLLATLAAIEMDFWWQGHTTDRGHVERRKDHRAVPSIAIVSLATMVMVAIACVFPCLLVSFSELAEGEIAVEGRGKNLDPMFFSFYGLLAAAAFTFLFEMWQFSAFSHHQGGVTNRLGKAILIYVYLSLLFGFLIPHRWLEHHNGLGLISIIALIATVKSSDTAAYFMGKLIGTVKLAPELSPKKTVEGAVGAFIGGYAAVAIVFFVVAPTLFAIRIEKPLYWFVLYGFAITAAGILGDLAESLLKRDAQKKDSGSWLPGLGGALDVIDSLIFAAPVSYLLWIM